MTKWFKALIRKKVENEETLVYKTYSQALLQCNNVGYEDKELCNIIAQKTKKYKEALQAKPYLIKPVQCYLTLVIQHVLLNENKKQVSVVDFGGACGAHYFETRRLLDENIKLDWEVVETNAIIESAKIYQLEQGELRFSNDINDTASDLIYLSSSIQYVPDPYSTIELIISKKIPYILFNRMMLNTASEEDLIIVQQSLLSANGPGEMLPGIEDRVIKYPHTTLSEKKFLKKFEAEYELVFKFDESSGKIEQNNANIVGGGFLFKRK